jgi:hypothetical protein
MDPQSFPAILGEGIRVHEEAVRLRLSSAYPASELMQRREAEDLGVLHDHTRCVGDIDPDFDDARRDENLDVPSFERLHGIRSLRPVHPGVGEANAVRGETAPELDKALLGTAKAPGTALVDCGVDHVRLVPGVKLTPNEIVDPFVVPIRARWVRTGLRLGAGW